MMYLKHYGVLGMHWGVRRSPEELGHPSKSHTTKTKRGETLELRRQKPGLLARGLRRVSKTARKEAAKTYNYDMVVSGKKVGDFQMYQKPKGEMNMTWGSTNKKYRGRGYMQSAIALGEQIAKEHGNVKITGELVGDSPDIFTVAEHRNFRKVGEIKTEEALEMWGGLTLIEKDL